MNERYNVLFGVISPIVGIFFTITSIILSPWFNWRNNALSDLGHSINSEVASLFNIGLLISGFLLIYYSISIFKNHAKYTSYFLIFAGLMFQLVATFDEIYGYLHFQVSLLFFVALGFVSLTYIIEKRSIIASISLFIGLISWIVYGMNIIKMGIAIPETISSFTTSIWIILSARSIYLDYQ